jgi:hypothetical protein
MAVVDDDGTREEDGRTMPKAWVEVAESVAWPLADARRLLPIPTASAQWIGRGPSHTARGASPYPWVEVAGIEPASVVVPPGLLRVQPVAVFLGPSDLTGTSLPGSVV